MKKLLSIATVACLGSLFCDMVSGMNAGSYYYQQIARNAQQAYCDAVLAHNQGRNNLVKDIVSKCNNSDVFHCLFFIAVTNDCPWLVEEVFLQYGSRMNFSFYSSKDQSILTRAISVDTVSSIQEYCEHYRQAQYSKQVAQFTEKTLNDAVQAHNSDQGNQVKNIVRLSCSNTDVLRNLLEEAVQRNYFWLAKEIFEQYGSQIKVDDWRDEEDRTLFMQAVINDNVEMTELLAIYGASVFDENSFDKHGNGAVYYAIKKGGRVLDWMYLNGFDFNQFCANRREMPLIVAHKENKDILKKMLSWKNIDKTAFFRSVSWDDLIREEDFDLFNDKINHLGNEFALKDMRESGISLLETAISRNKFAFIKYLIEHVIDAATMKDHVGDVLSTAVRKSNILQYLLTIPEVAEGINIQGGTLNLPPIFMAIYEKNVRSVEVLCQQSEIDFGINDDRGRTALDIAKEEERKSSSAEEKRDYAEIIQIITEAIAKRKQKSE